MNQNSDVYMHSYLCIYLSIFMYIYRYIYIYISITLKPIKLPKKTVFAPNSSNVVHCSSYRTNILWYGEKKWMNMKNEMIPDDWNKSILYPIPKKDDRTYYDNYRGITLPESPEKISLLSCWINLWQCQIAP